MEELYNQLKSKFSLPDYHKINHVFEISDIDESEFLIRNIRNKILDKLEEMIKILDELLQPEGNFSSLHEVQFIDEPLKRILYGLYRELRLLDRTASELSIKEDDVQTCEFITNVVERWDVIESNMLKILIAVKESWNRDFESEGKLRYFG